MKTTTEKKTADCFFRKITPAVAKREPKYAAFVGMFLVTECTDRLTQGAIVPEEMIVCEQIRYSGSSCQPVTA